MKPDPSINLLAMLSLHGEWKLGTSRAKGAKKYRCTIWRPSAHWSMNPKVSVLASTPADAIRLCLRKLSGEHKAETARNAGGFKMRIAK